MDSELNRSLQEARESQIDLSAEDSDVLSRMIDFLYTSDYTVLEEPAAPIHVAIYAMSIKFEIPALQAIAKARFEQELSSATMTRVNLIELIPEVYNTTFEGDRSLREPLVGCLGDKVQEFLLSPKFESAHKASPDFAFDLLRYRTMKDARATYLDKLYTCETCNAAMEKLNAGKKLSYHKLVVQHKADSEDFKHTVEKFQEDRENNPLPADFIWHFSVIKEMSRKSKE